MFCATQSTAELQHVSRYPATIQAHPSITVYSPQHNQAISSYISSPQPKRRPGMPHNNKLHNHDHNTPRQSAGQQGKAQEQDEPGLPRHPVTRVREAVGGQARLVDAVDDEHAEGAADTGDPVDEGDVDGGVGAVHGGLGPRGYVDEGVETHGELCNIATSASSVTDMFGGEVR